MRFVFFISWFFLVHPFGSSFVWDSTILHFIFTWLLNRVGYWLVSDIPTSISCLTYFYCVPQGWLHFKHSYFPTRLKWDVSPIFYVLST